MYLGPDLAAVSEAEEEKEELETEVSALDTQNRKLQDQLAESEGEKQQHQRNADALKADNKVSESSMQYRVCIIHSSRKWSCLFCCK